MDNVPIDNDRYCSVCSQWESTCDCPCKGQPLSPSDTVPRQESGEDKQREFEDAVAKHVAQFNGSYMKQVREESFRAGAAWEYWDGEADRLSADNAKLREELGRERENLRLARDLLAKGHQNLAAAEAEVKKLREALEKADAELHKYNYIRAGLIRADFDVRAQKAHAIIRSARASGLGETGEKGEKA